MAGRPGHVSKRPPPAHLEEEDAVAYMVQLRQQQRGHGPDHRHREVYQQEVSRALGHYPASEEWRLHPAKPYVTRKSISGLAQAHAYFVLNLCSTGG
jgi:hypothetical protein